MSYRHGTPLSSDENPRVSVVVPVYDVEAYLPECLDSVLGQDYANLELIAIDDGSPDGSGRILDDYAARDARIIVRHTENSGVSSARNLGLEICSGDFVCFLDADDVLAPWFVSEMLSLAREFDADFVISDHATRAPTWGPKTRYHGRVVTRDRATAELLYPRIPIGSWNKLYSRRFLDQAGLRFDTSLFAGEGQHFVTTAAQLSRTTVITSNSGYYYRLNRPGSAVTAESAEKWMNALESISTIRSSLTVRSREVLVALDFHEWETRTLIVKFFHNDENPDARSISAECRKFIRGCAFRLALRARVSAKYRAKILLSGMSPRALAALQLWWNRKKGTSTNH